MPVAAGLVSASLAPRRRLGIFDQGAYVQRHIDLLGASSTKAMEEVARFFLLNLLIAFC